MSWWKGARVRLRGWLRRDQVEQEIEEEMQWHLAMETEKYVRSGMSPDEARRRAGVAFGGVERHREEHRDVRGMRRIERAWQDVRYSVAALAKSRTFTAVAVLTLAIGIGANTTAFGILHVLTRRAPVGVGEPERAFRVRALVPPSSGVIALTQSALPPFLVTPASYPDYIDLRDAVRDLGDVAAYWPKILIEGRGTEAREVKAISATSNYFDVLRVRPTLGRFWSSGSDQNAEAEAVLAHGFWKSRFGGDPGVIGKTIALSDISFTIVGVAPPHFRGIDLEAVDVLIPLGLEPLIGNPDYLTNRDLTSLLTVGRLRSGVTEAAMTGRANETWRALNEGSLSIRDDERIDLAPLANPFAGIQGTAPFPEWTMGVTAVVLLVACANVSNLLLARGAGRRRELAVRIALGASRGRLIQLLLIESLLLATVGGIAGVALSAALAEGVHVIGLPPLDPFIDLRVIAFSAAVVLTTTLLAGLLPAVRSSRADVERDLRAGGARSSSERSRLRAGLTVLQVALSIVLLLNAGLFVRSLQNVIPSIPGSDLDHTVMVSLRLPRGASTDRVAAIKSTALARLRALPEVRSATLASNAPFGAGLGITRLDPAALGLPDGPPLAAVPLDVGPEYFGIVGVPLVRGRLLNESDVAGALTVAVVNTALARMLGGIDAALGKCIPVRGSCAQIVGVVGDSRFISPSEELRGAFYRPIEQAATAPARIILLVRTQNDLPTPMSAIRTEVAAAGADVQFIGVKTMTEALSPKLRPWRTASLIFSLSGGAAFLLAVIGLYGVITYLVASREQELGVRLALGARPLSVFGLVLTEGIWLIAIGVGLGLVVAPWVSALLLDRMYGVRAIEPQVYLLTLLLVVAVAGAATLMGARRAARIDPASSLRRA